MLKIMAVTRGRLRRIEASRDIRMLRTSISFSSFSSSWLTSSIVSASYPKSRTTWIISETLMRSGSKETVALSVVRLTPADCTPGRELSFFSIRAEQAAQVMPVTFRSV